MIDNIGVGGVFTVRKKDRTEYSINNLIMDTVLNKMAETLRGVAPDIQIKYLAVGTDNTPVTASDTTLGTEVFRTAVTTSETTGNGIVQHSFVIFDNEAVANLKEMGVFGGAAATGSADTGTLISRILFDEDKTSDEELNILYTNTILRK